MKKSTCKKEKTYHPPTVKNTRRWKKTIYLGGSVADMSDTECRNYLCDLIHDLNLIDKGVKKVFDALHDIMP